MASHPPRSLLELASYFSLVDRGIDVRLSAGRRSVSVSHRPSPRRKRIFRPLDLLFFFKKKTLFFPFLGVFRFVTRRDVFVIVVFFLLKFQLFVVGFGSAPSCCGAPEFASFLSFFLSLSLSFFLSFSFGVFQSTRSMDRPCDPMEQSTSHRQHIDVLQSRRTLGIDVLVFAKAFLVNIGITRLKTEFFFSKNRQRHLIL